MGCATGIVKYFVFLANLVFALAGLGLIIIGVLYKFNYNDATKALPSDFGIAPILSIIIGVIVFVTAFLGCCGAVKESPCMLTTYAIILLVIFILQVAIGVYAFLQIKDTNEFRHTIRKGLEQPFRDYNTNEKSREVVDVTQRFLKCCGLDRTDDILDRNHQPPRSCCSSERDECLTTHADFHNQPCGRALVNFMEGSAQVIGGVAIGIAVIEFKCCGLDGPDSFSPNGTFPRTCCEENLPKEEPCTNKIMGMLYHESCVDSVTYKVTHSSKIVAGVLIGIALIEIFGAIFGFCLASSIKNQYRRNLYA